MRPFPTSPTLSGGHGPLPEFVKAELAGFPGCGDFARGFVRTACRTCGDELGCRSRAPHRAWIRAGVVSPHPARGAWRRRARRSGPKRASRGRSRTRRGSAWRSAAEAVGDGRGEADDGVPDEPAVRAKEQGLTHFATPRKML